MPAVFAPLQLTGRPGTAEYEINLFLQCMMQDSTARSSKQKFEEFPMSLRHAERERIQREYVRGTEIWKSHGNEQYIAHVSAWGKEKILPVLLRQTNLQTQLQPCKMLCIRLLCLL